MITKNLPSGQQVQSIILSKEHFPTLDDAMQWVRDAGGDVSDAEILGDGTFVFHQFPTSRVKGRMKTVETEHTGITATICKVCKENDMADNNDLAGGERHNLGTGHDTLPTMSDGAAFMAKLHGITDEGTTELEKHRKLIDHPEVRKYAEDHHGQLKGHRSYLAKAMKDWYPEVKFEAPDNLQPSDMDDEAIEAEQDAYIKHYKRCRKAIRKAMDDADAVRDAGMSAPDAAAAAAGSASGMAPGSGVQQIKMPMGARAVVKAMDHLHAAHKAIEEDMPLQEHPEVVKLCKSLNEALPAKKEELKGMLKQHYAEVHKSLGWEDAEAEAMAEEEAEEITEEVAGDIPDEGEEGTTETETEKEPADESTSEESEAEETETEEEGDETESEEKSETEKKPKEAVNEEGEGDGVHIDIASHNDDDPEEKAFQIQVAKGNTWLTIKGANSLPEARKYASGLVKQGISYQIIGKDGHPTQLKSAPPWFLKKISQKSKTKATKMTTKKTVTKLGPNTVSPPPQPQPNIAPAGGADDLVEGDPIAVIDAIIEYLSDMKMSLGGEQPVNVLASNEDNPYAMKTPASMRMAPGKKIEEDEVVEKGTEEEEELPDGISKADILELAKSIKDVKKTNIEFAQKVGYMIS